MALNNADKLIDKKKLSLVMDNLVHSMYILYVLFINIPQDNLH